MQNQKPDLIGLANFLAAARPELKFLFDRVVSMEGYKTGVYVFNQIIAEVVELIGAEATTVLFAKPEDREIARAYARVNKIKLGG